VAQEKLGAAHADAEKSARIPGGYFSLQADLPRERLPEYGDE
jgi:hypothetical protein